MIYKQCMIKKSYLTELLENMVSVFFVQALKQEPNLVREGGRGMRHRKSDRASARVCIDRVSVFGRWENVIRWAWENWDRESLRKKSEFQALAMCILHIRFQTSVSIWGFPETRTAYFDMDISRVCFLFWKKKKNIS